MLCSSRLTYLALVSALFLALTSCSDGDSSNALNRGGEVDVASNFKPGTITVSITDAAIDSAQEVWVQFNGITIQPSTGSSINFTFDSPRIINLLSLQGTLSSDFLTNEVIPLGQYSWIRLHVNAIEDGILDSYIKLNDGSEHELSIPGANETGLKINTGFELTATKELRLMIDFDLRKSVVLSAGQYKLRPTLRMTDLKDTNNIVGAIDPSLLTGVNCSDSDPTTGNSVYLFEGSNIIADDIYNGNSNPITSANVTLNTSNGTYEYVIGFVPAGSYTIAFTCQADLDDPDINDNIIFGLTQNVTVVAPVTDQESLVLDHVR